LEDFVETDLAVTVKQDWQKDKVRGSTPYGMVVPVH
jgi:hypothetical protein